MINDELENQIQTMAKASLGMDFIANTLKLSQEQVEAVINLKRRQEVATRQRRARYNRDAKSLGGSPYNRVTTSGNRTPVKDIVRLKRPSPQIKRTLTQVLCGDPQPHQQRWRT